MDISTSSQQCNICDKNYKTRNLLQIHIFNVHREKVEKISQCDICHKVLKGSIKLHINVVHHGKKPTKCESCGKLYSEAGTLKRHVEAIHDRKKNH